jgi:hypothetical protein
MDVGYDRDTHYGILLLKLQRLDEILEREAITDDGLASVEHDPGAEAGTGVDEGVELAILTTRINTLGKVVKENCACCSTSARRTPCTLTRS